MSGVKKALTRKLGPLPVWAWAAIAGVATYFYRNRGGAGAKAAADDKGSPDTTLPYVDTAAGPYASGAGADSSGAGADSGAGTHDYYADEKLRQAGIALVDQLRGITDDAAAAAGGGSINAADPETLRTAPPDDAAGSTKKHGTAAVAASGKASSRPKKGKHSGAHKPKKARTRGVRKPRPRGRTLPRGGKKKTHVAKPHRPKGIAKKTTLSKPRARPAKPRHKVIVRQRHGGRPARPR